MTVTAEAISRMIDAGVGARPLDLVVRGGKLLDVYRGGWVEGDLGIDAGRVVAFGGDSLEADEVLDATGKWVVPGFFDPHYHAGGSHLSPTRLADAFLECGTTSTVCDFQEHYVVAGIEAARFALDEARAAGLRVYYLAPIHMYVVEGLGMAGLPMVADDLLAMLDWPETVAINEPPPGPVLGKDEGALRVIAKALSTGKIYAGHAPAFTGRTLQAYIATGASSDHESTRAEEAWDKLAYGMKTMMRHGSAAPDMRNLVELAVEHPAAARHMMLATDEVDPVDLSEHGHMQSKIRLAVERGVDPVLAYQMVTINPAEYYRVDHEIGSLAPGRFADAVVLDDPETASIDTVIAEGRVVEPGRRSPLPDPASCPAGVRSHARLPRPLEPEDFAVPAPGEEATVRVVGIKDGSLLSSAEEATLPVIEGSVAPDPSRDLLKMAVIDRHRGEGELVTGFVRGFGFSEGAVATTYAHPYYNILVVGTDEESMAAAANAVSDTGGGIVVVADGEVAERWDLEVVGVFSNAPLEEVRERFAAMNRALQRLGCDFRAPVLALSFAVLPTIPDYGLTTRGLYDVNAGAFVDIVG